MSRLISTAFMLLISVHSYALSNDTADVAKSDGGSDRRSINSFTLACMELNERASDPKMQKDEFEKLGAICAKDSSGKVTVERYYKHLGKIPPTAIAGRTAYIQVAEGNGSTKSGWSSQEIAALIKLELQSQGGKRAVWRPNLDFYDKNLK